MSGRSNRKCGPIRAIFNSVGSKHVSALNFIKIFCNCRLNTKIRKDIRWTDGRPSFGIIRVESNLSPSGCYGSPYKVNLPSITNGVGYRNDSIPSEFYAFTYYFKTLFLSEFCRQMLKIVKLFTVESFMGTCRKSDPLHSLLNSFRSLAKICQCTKFQNSSESIGAIGGRICVKLFWALHTSPSTWYIIIRV